METTILEVVISPDGRYLSGSPALLDETGYTEDELRALPLGRLSAADHDAAAEVWRRYVSGEVNFPVDRHGQLRRKDGTLVPILLVDLEERPDGSRRSRFRVVSRTDPSKPRALQYILAEWREAERALAGVDPDAADRPALEQRVDDLRTLFQSETARQRTRG
jgi:PAS domain S-box-containing protein